MKRFSQGESSLKAMVRTHGNGAQLRELERLEKMAALGRSYLGALRGEVKRLMLTAEETMPAEVAESVTDKLGEEELRALRRVYGACTARRLGSQLPPERAAADGDEGAFVV